MRKGAYERMAAYSLPNRDDVTLYRVRWPGKRLNRRGNSWVLENGSTTIELDPHQAEVAQWVLSRDLFCRQDVIEAFPAARPEGLSESLARLGRIDVIEEI